VIIEHGRIVAAGSLDQIMRGKGLTAENIDPRIKLTIEPLGPNRVIFTKLDETVSFGVLVNAARRIGAGLSFVTTGQEVPDHIEPGRPERLARLVLDGGFAR